MHEVFVYKAQSDFDRFNNPSWELFPSGDYVWFVDWEDNSLNHNNSDYPPLKIKNNSPYMNEWFTGTGRFFSCACLFLEGILKEGDYCQAIDRGRFVAILRVTITILGIYKEPREGNNGG